MPDFNQYIKQQPSSQQMIPQGQMLAQRHSLIHLLVDSIKI